MLTAAALAQEGARVELEHGGPDHHASEERARAAKARLAQLQEQEEARLAEKVPAAPRTIRPRAPDNTLSRY